MTRLTTDDLTAADLADWRKLAQSLHARFRVTEPPDLQAALGFAAAAGEALSTPDRFARLTVHPWGVEMAVGTLDDGYWVTEADLDAARAVSAIAVEHGLRSDPAGVVQVEFGMDTAQHERLGPFWAAVLLGDAAGMIHGEVIDPSGASPNVWWQRTEQTDADTPRQRWHPDVWLPPEAVQPRIDAAVAAGGTVVDHS